MDDAFATLADLRRLCALGTPEGLHLEYKGKKRPTSPVEETDDIRNAAKMIAAFANSDGGTLIFGIRSERCNGLDRAVALQPITQVGDFADRLRLVAVQHVSPQVAGLTVRAVEDAAGAGCVVIQVPRSDARPHMSTAPKVHSYYRRGFEGSVPMTPSEVRDQILATRDAVLEPIVTLGAGLSTDRPDQVGLTGSFRVGLRNVGQRLCRDPFLRIGADCRLWCYDFTFDERLAAWKSDYQPGLLIHVDDDGPGVTLRFLARLDKTIFRDAVVGGPDALLDAITIHPGSEPHDLAAYAGPPLDGITLAVHFGAENVSAQSRTWSYSRVDLARRLLRVNAARLRDLLRAERASWDDDPFVALAAP